MKDEEVNNGNGNTTTQSPPSRLAHIHMKPRRSNLLWKMLAIAFAVHLIIILCTSKSLFFTDSESPQQLFEKGESAMAAHHYLEAQEYYQKVLDLQPKVPPIFERAAEQHRLADKLAKDEAAKPPATREVKPDTDPTPTTQLAPIKVVPTSKPAFEVPPELRGK